VALRADGRLRAGNNILWIGCAPYTAGYYKLLEKEGAKCSTIDIDPGQEYWGRRGRHIVGSLLNLDRHYPLRAFDLILCNGVLGWGVDAIEDQRRAFSVMAQTLKPGGVLVVGWNTDTMADPVASNLHMPHFEHADIAGFPRRRAVPNTTHVYDCFRGGM
jgi:SAM-dependent methyltransferase